MSLIAHKLMFSCLCIVKYRFNLTWLLIALVYCSINRNILPQTLKYFSTSIYLPSTILARIYIICYCFFFRKSLAEAIYFDDPYFLLSASILDFFYYTILSCTAIAERLFNPIQDGGKKFLVPVFSL